MIAGHALGLTPLVFLIAAVMFTLTAMTYVEGASLHQDRGGSTVFARYAFNELVSFVAGWAILLDYVILIAVTAFSATQYLQVFWGHLGDTGEALGLALAFIALVVLSNIRGFGHRRARRVGILLAGDIALQAFIVVLGLVLFFDPKVWLDPIHLGTRADVVEPDLRADRHRGRVHEPRVGVGALGRGADQPRRAEAARLEHDRRPSRSSTSGSRSSRSPRCPSTAGTPRSAGATSTRR